MRRSRIIGLAEFGITGGELRRTPERLVSYCMDLRGPSLDRLRPFTPKQRKDRIAAHLKASVAWLRAHYAFKSFRPRDARYPWTIDAVSGAGALVELARSRRVRSLLVQRVSGARRSRDEGSYLFTVRAQVVIQVEGQERGMQTVEERFVTVRAFSEASAIRAIRPMWREYAQPYLNPRGEFVRWQLEKVLEVYPTFERRFNPAGTEVYSRLASRRVNPSFTWRP